MDIQRAIWQKTSWPVSVQQLTALLDVVDEQEIPLDIVLEQEQVNLLLHEKTIHCHHRDSCVDIMTTEGEFCIDLEQLEQIQVVSRLAGAARGFSLELSSRSGSSTLVLSGPHAQKSHVGQVWSLLMEALMPAPKTFSRQRVVLA